MSADKNPYGDQKGIPLTHQEADFFAWARATEFKRRETLTDSEVKEIEASEQALRDRMNS